jgi:tetratricopeptide (TPR) repeat protein
MTREPLNSALLEQLMRDSGVGLRDIRRRRPRQPAPEATSLARQRPKGTPDETGKHDWYGTRRSCYDSDKRAPGLGRQLLGRLRPKEDVDRVIDACTEVLAEEGNPNRARAYGNRCAALTYRKDYDRAIADCDKAIELDPKPARGYYVRCWVYLQKEDYDRGIADCDKAIELDPKFAKAYLDRCGNYWGKKDYDRAISDCNKAIELEPKFAEAYTARCLIYTQKQERDRAIADCDQAIELDPKSARAYNLRCLNRVTVGQLQSALADCNESLSLRPGYRTLNSRGLVYLKLGDYDRAIADYDAALRIDPNCATSLYGRGIAKLWKRDESGGNSDIASAKAIKPDIAEEFAIYGVNDSNARPAAVSATAVKVTRGAGCPLWVRSGH